MPITITDLGENNTVEIDPDHLQKGEGRIKLYGSGNTVKIGKPWEYGWISIQLWNNSNVLIESGCEFHVLHIFAPRGASVCVGEGTTFNGSVELHMTEDKGVTIGKGCLIAADTFFWPSDMHSVVSADTDRRVNPSKEIVLGDRVWVASRCLVLKGSKIGSGSIIGAGSILAREVPENCVAAGNPAKVVRQNVTWDRALLAITEEPAIQSKPTIFIKRFRSFVSALLGSKAG
jgi:acetyltransferase-like isoleucine patch superfamily enzyme